MERIFLQNFYNVPVQIICLLLDILDHVPLVTAINTYLVESKESIQCIPIFHQKIASKIKAKQHTDRKTDKQTKKPVSKY